MGRYFGGDWGLLASSSLRYFAASSGLPLALSNCTRRARADASTRDSGFGIRLHRMTCHLDPHLPFPILFYERIDHLDHDNSPHGETSTGSLPLTDRVETETVEARGIARSRRQRPRLLPGRRA